MGSLENPNGFNDPQAAQLQLKTRAGVEGDS